MPVTVIDFQERVRARRDRVAESVRRRLSESRTPVVNIMSAPEAGKTLLLERTLEALNTELNIAVITADGRARDDARRIARHTGLLVHAVDAHEATHLDVLHLDRALRSIDLDYTQLLLVENGGDPAAAAQVDLAADRKVVLVSMHEDVAAIDRVAPAIEAASAIVFTKCDLMSERDFDVEEALSIVERLNPLARLFILSAATGHGVDAWLDFLRGLQRDRGALRAERH